MNSRLTAMGILAAGVGALGVAAPARADVTFRIKKVFTSKYAGGQEQPYTPKIGEAYRLAVEFEVLGTPKAPYQVAFSMADRRKVVDVSSLAPGTRTMAAKFNLPLGDTIPFEVEIDPYKRADGGDPTKSKIPLQIPDVYGEDGQEVSASRPSFIERLAGKRVMAGFFKPVPPSKSIDYFDPVQFTGFQEQVIRFNAGGKIDRMALMMGAPASESWQKVVSTGASVKFGQGANTLKTQPVENQTFYPVFFWDKANVPVANVTLRSDFTLELRNVRVDADKLRQVTWQDLDAVKGINVFKFYQSPEAVIQSNDPKITDFVKQTLGANYRQKLTPYDAAKQLFQAVVKRTTYTYPKEGEKDLRPPDAMGVLEKKLGDCGGFSLLLVAVFRNIGFPARAACGGWAGTAVSGHCWSEMWFPKNGWVASDGSAGNGMSEYGEYPYYFGNLLDLNARYASMRGNTFNVKDVSTSWLQGPIWPQVWGTAKLKKVDVTTSLVEVPAPSDDGRDGGISAGGIGTGGIDAGGAGAGRKAGRAELPDLRIAALARARASRHCPCGSHGGLRPLAPRLDLGGR